MRHISVVTLFALAAVGALGGPITFTNLVPGPSILAVEGQNNTIGFTYAGNKFVGSVYQGANNAQLYSTDLTGGALQKFGSPVPGGADEIVIAGSLGQAGFPTADIYAGSNSTIYHFANSGGAPAVFASGFNGTIRGILFDPGSTFGGNMLVSTTSGSIYKVDSAGTKTLLASVGEDTEGMDIATTAWGSFGGQLLVGSEASGNLRLINPSGLVTLLTGINVPMAESVSFVPLNLGASGNPIEGLYASNYPVNIQFAAASQFAGMLGDAIITSEDSVNSRVWALHYNGSAFSLTQVGNLPNQAEDGIFVTKARITESSPEPASLLLLGGGLAGMGFLLRRRKG